MLKIEVIYRNRPIIVSIDSDAPNRAAMIEYEGDTANLFQMQISRLRGAFGHLVGSMTTPIDLHHAIANSGYEFRVLEGEELIQKYDPGIPGGAVT